MKDRIFPYFKILNFRNDDVTFETSATAILAKRTKKNRTTLSVIANRTEIEIKENDNELQRTFRVATIVLLQ